MSSRQNCTETMRRRGQRGRGTRRSRGAVRRRRLTHSAEAGQETATGSLQRSHRRAATVKRRRRHRPRRKFSVVPPRDSAPSCGRAAVPSAASPVPPTSAGHADEEETPVTAAGEASRQPSNTVTRQKECEGGEWKSNSSGAERGCREGQRTRRKSRGTPRSNAWTGERRNVNKQTEPRRPRGQKRS